MRPVELVFRQGGSAALAVDAAHVEVRGVLEQRIDFGGCEAARDEVAVVERQGQTRDGLYQRGGALGVLASEPMCGSMAKTTSRACACSTRHASSSAARAVESGFGS